MDTRPLPDDGELSLGTMRLPAGKRIRANYGSGAPVAWATVERVPDPGRVWMALSEISAQTGLMPFLLSGLDDTLGGRPWDNGEFSDPVDVSPLAEMDPAELLKELWKGETEDAVDESDLDDDDDWGDDFDDEDELDEEFAAMIAPFSPGSQGFPGLAPASDQPLTAQEVERAIGSLRPARIGLAAASRPADVLPRIGWEGAVNAWDNALVIAAILRSWEERFGARLLRVGFAEIEVLAQRPPRGRPAAQLLAAEQFAFCDECAGRGLHDVSSITEHLLRSPIWTFWWD